MESDLADNAVPYGVRKKRPVAVEMKEGRVIFTYSDGTTSDSPYANPLSFVNRPAEKRGNE